MSSDGARSQCSGWAPLRLAEIIGPSKCRPSGSAPVHPAGGPPASVARACFRAAGSLVMRVGTNATTPYAGSADATSQSRCGSAVRSIPAAPLTWMSTSPDTMLISASPSE